MNRTRAAAALRRLRSGAAPEEAQAIDLAVATLEAEPTDWPRLTEPARVGHTSFGHNVSARLVVECAQRAYRARREEAAMTPAQHREDERNRRTLWDLINGPLDPTGVYFAMPRERDVARMDDMHENGHLRVLIEQDGDVCISVWDGDGGASVEFCAAGGNGGGRSSRTRAALIALMVAMEADNAEKPSLDWWALRRAEKPAAPAPAPAAEASLADEEACSFCLERGCNGQCGGDDMMGASS